MRLGWERGQAQPVCFVLKHCEAVWYPFDSSFGERGAAIHLVAIQLFFRKGGDQDSGRERMNHLQRLKKNQTDTILKLLRPLKQSCRALQPSSASCSIKKSLERKQRGSSCAKVCSAGGGAAQRDLGRSCRHRTMESQNILGWKGPTGIPHQTPGPAQHHPNPMAVVSQHSHSPRGGLADGLNASSPDRTPP